MSLCVCVCILSMYILIYISVGVGDLFCLPLGFAAIEFHWAAPSAVINLIWVICMTFGRVDPTATTTRPHPRPPRHCYPTVALLVVPCPPQLVRLVHFLLFASSITLFASARADRQFPKVDLRPR